MTLRWPIGHKFFEYCNSSEQLINTVATPLFCAGGSVSVVSSQYQLSRLALTWYSVAVRWELQGCTHSSGADSRNGGYYDTKNEGIGLKA